MMNTRQPYSPNTDQGSEELNSRSIVKPKTSKSHDLHQLIMMVLVATDVLVITGCIVYICTCFGLAFRKGHFTTTNLFMSVWSCFITIGLSLLLIMEEVSGSWKYRLNWSSVGLNVAHFLAVFFLLQLCFITAVCYSITKVEINAIITWWLATLRCNLLLLIIGIRLLSQVMNIMKMSSSPSMMGAEVQEEKNQPSANKKVLFFLAIFTILKLLVAATIIMGFNNAGPRAQLASSHPAPGKALITPLAVKLHIKCNGWGNMTVVLDTDLGEVGVTAWKYLFNKLVPHTRVCWYDRGGYGWSRSGVFPRAAYQLAKELRMILYVSGESFIIPRFILVGHGFSASIHRVFQFMYPQLVHGLVMLDAPSESSTLKDLEAIQDSLFKERTSFEPNAAIPIFEPFGFTKKTYKHRPYYSSAYADTECTKGVCYDSNAAFSMFNNRYSLAVYFEERNYALTQKQVIERTNYTKPHPLDDLPVGVFTAGVNVNGTCEIAGVDMLIASGYLSKGDRSLYCAEYYNRLQTFGPRHAAQQEELAKLSSNTITKTYWNSRHNIQLDYPDELASDILTVVDMAIVRYFKNQTAI